MYIISMANLNIVTIETTKNRKADGNLDPGVWCVWMKQS